MRLEDVETAVFGHLVYWIYYQKIELDERLDSNGILRQEHPNPVLLGRLWVLAERFLMPKLQNDAIDCMGLSIQWYEDPQLQLAPITNFAYSTNSKTLQRFAVDVCASRSSSSGFAKLVEEIPREAAVEVAKSLKKFCDSLRQKQSTAPTSEFHVKDDEAGK
jgi:hypothetical protein